MEGFFIFEFLARNVRARSVHVIARSFRPGKARPDELAEHHVALGTRAENPIF